MSEILVIKTAALGDVLRTTSILPGLMKRHAGARITWLTAPSAVDLVRTHPLVHEVIALDTKQSADVDVCRIKLATRRYERVISLDDEAPLCRLASAMNSQRLHGAFAKPDGTLAYTPDTAPWFEMGLLSVHGKKRADELKVENQRSQPEIYAAMLGIDFGKPALHLPAPSTEKASAFAAKHALDTSVPLVGLNTGAGGRWLSKQLPVERTIALAKLVERALEGRVRFLVLGGDAEGERNDAIHRGIGARAIDGGTKNSLFDFAVLVELCDVLVTSDSLALHMAIARDVRCVAFFAPTSAAEIELYELGEKVVSTASDYCSYKADADNSSITPERLRDAVLRQLALAKTG
ncbi:MAG: glycosyltransferase family 9 protein [Planctomycetota bacterium]|nr:glycosyltransferase family 9 protein [Planctomycetota bacterium]